MKHKLVKRLFAGSILALSALTISLGALTISWFVGPNVETDDKYLNGDIGLRNYFYTGDGSQTRPFEIVSPVHFYNLTRLQNLGIFPEKKYFQIGHLFNIDGEMKLRCINTRDEHGEPIYDDFLDMGPMSSSRMLMTIGGEGVPFFGDIDGNGVPIKNLTIHGMPEDVGVFGYVAHTGSLSDLVFDNLEVDSLGYNATVGDEDNLLFSEDIDDIFNSSSFLATDTSLSFYKYNGETYEENYLKKLNGVSGTQFININADENMIGDTTMVNGYFKATFPETTAGRPFTYSLRSSSPLVQEVGTLNLTGTGETDFVIDLEALKTSTNFNAGAHAQANAKIYLVASCEVDGYVFSRVIQSYTIEFYSNGHKYDDKQYGMGIYCDYIQQEILGDHNTRYHHGNNIGLIAGHVDGNMQDCYVYNGRFKFNDSEYHPIQAETDTALVGEIGSNVSNALDPELGLKVHGDIGVMNFSKIYNMIRTDMTPSTTIKGGQKTAQGGKDPVNYVSYKEFINEETIDNFKQYLRYMDGELENNEYITKTTTSMSKSGVDPVWHDYTTPSTVEDIKNNHTDFNSVDFLWNNVIEDEDDIDRGLGVFKVVSSYNAGAKTGTYGEYMVNNIGECRIINGNPLSNVYFSTAEYDHTKGGSWSPKRATTLPSYSDIRSFEYPFSRDFDYVFQLDLTQMDRSGGKDYMYNTDSEFLTNYLSTKLIDKYGAPVAAGSARFGFMFRSSENESLSSLSSYMPVGKPKDKQPFKDGSLYLPPNSIVFSIDNPNGANVSVVARGSDATIYSFDPTIPQGSTKESKVNPLYTMRCSGGAETDNSRYFTYDISGETSTQVVPYYDGNMNDGKNALYGHIFKLPQGDYVLGSNDNDYTNVYFLAVQGQTEGTLGDNEMIAIGDAIENVDFLLTAPTLADFTLGFNKALFSYKGTFNLNSGTVTMDVVELSNKKYMRVAFATSPTFVTYILTYSRSTDHTYYINDTLIDTVNYTYPSGG